MSYESKKELEVLKKDLDLLVALTDRFDIAIDRLSTVAQSVDKMLAVHETRLENQERQTEILHARINDFKKEIMEEFKDMRDENKNHHARIGERLERLEKWRWIVVGAATVCGVILAQNMDKIFTIFG